MHLEIVCAVYGRMCCFFVLMKLNDCKVVSFIMHRHWLLKLLLGFFHPIELLSCRLFLMKENGQQLYTFLITLCERNNFQMNISKHTYKYIVLHKDHFKVDNCSHFDFSLVIHHNYSVTNNIRRHCELVKC